jgi:hypothetical protein
VKPTVSRDELRSSVDGERGVAAVADHSVPVFVSRALGVVAVIIFSAWWFYRLRGPLSSPLYFDDAYMFYRYAMNMRAGLGISWNLDGIHTYGQTAPLWGLVIFLLSFLPLGVSKVMMLGSWVCSVAALVAMGWAVATNAKSSVMRMFWLPFVLAAGPVAGTVLFSWHATTGMETMLAVVLCAVFAGFALLWRDGRVRAEVVALAGLLLFFTRPESALAAILIPTLLFALSARTRKKGIATILGLFIAGAIVEMLVCKLYFHSALPLSFRMKSQHGYEGYAGNWHPFGSAYEFFSAFRFYLIGLAFLVRRSDWKTVVAFLFPTLLIFAYLVTVTQIMGFHSRFYLPYLPFLVVPALLMLDRRIADFKTASASQWSLRTIVVHSAAAVLVAICCHGVLPIRLASAADQHRQARKMVYDSVNLATVEGKTLPERPYLDVMWGLTDTVMNQLPRGSSIAASEVGYIGGKALQSNIIDLAGLNDNEIALHGFNMDALLQRKPDMIWMPHWDYSYQRGLMLTDPALLEQYDVYAGAANYGFAVRRDSPIKTQMDRQLKVLWATLYPGYEMRDFLVRSTSWTGQKHQAVDKQ